MSILKGKTVLVADDEADLVDILVEELEEAGARVIWAHDGEAALAALGEQKIDILVTDLKMPNVDGLELTGQIKKNTPATRVIVITGVLNEVAGLSKNPLIDAVLAKPLDLKMFIEKVADLVS